MFNSVPIIEAQSSDGKYSCKFARNRIDFFINFDDKINFLLKIKAFLAYFNGSNSIEIIRIGFVTRFIVMDPNPDEIISRLLQNNFKQIHSGDVFETFIKYVTRDKFGDMEINNFTTIEKSINDKGELGVLITRDFNTNPAQNYKDLLGSLNIEKFIAECQVKIKIDEIKNILWRKDQ
jgi:hypothetical protein